MEVIDGMAQTALLMLPFLPEPVLLDFAPDGSIFRNRHSFPDAGPVFKNCYLPFIVLDVGILRGSDEAVRQAHGIITAHHAVCHGHIALPCPLVGGELIDRFSLAVAILVFGADDAHTLRKVIGLLPATVGKPLVKSLDVQGNLQTVLKGSRLRGDSPAVLAVNPGFDRAVLPPRIFHQGGCPHLPFV